MATAAQVAQFRSAIDAVTLAATGDAKSLVAETVDPNPEVVRDRMIAATPIVAQPYLTASATLAATWYEDLRAESIGGAFQASLVDELSEDLASSIARYAVTPLFYESSTTVLALFAAGLQKAIAGAARETMISNAARDPASVRYARTPRAGCCAFCAMLASRGAVYVSESAALDVVGRGIERGVYTDKNGRPIVRGGGTKARGSRGLGSDGYHDFCRCVATPLFPGDSMPYDLGHYRDMYQQASGAGHEVRNGQRVYVLGTADASTTLELMREQQGLR